MKLLSMRGVKLDMSLLMARNEQKPSLGNARMNARGDIIGRRGEVIKKREVIAQEYYAMPSKSVKQVSLRDLSSEVFQTPTEAVQSITKKAAEEAAKTSNTPPTHRKRKIEDRED